MTKISSSPDLAVFRADQAIANGRGEGFIATPEFAADLKQVALGKMTEEALRQKIAAKALNVPQGGKSNDEPAR